MFKYLQDGTINKNDDAANGDNLELLVFNSIINGQESNIENAKASISDALILDFACAWLGMSLDSESDDSLTVKASYYFFDELCSSSNTANDKTWTCLMICHLKMGHLQEAEECLSHIKGETQSTLVGQIALASIKGDDETREKLTSQLQSAYPSSAYVKDLNDKNALFDQIVASY